jgi:hypothetical protein
MRLSRELLYWGRLKKIIKQKTQKPGNSGREGVSGIISVQDRGMNQEQQNNDKRVITVGIYPYFSRLQYFLRARPDFCGFGI